MSEDDVRPWIEIPAPDYLPSRRPGVDGMPPPTEEDKPEEVERVIIIDL